MKNYTSSVPVETTISRIEKILAKFGATGVAKSYKNGEVDSLQFSIVEPASGKGVVIRLPAKVDAVRKILTKDVRRPRSSTHRSRSTEERINDQAGRTAWRIIQDWVEVQLSLIEMGQAEVLQVFLPYMWNGERTYYELAKGSKFKMLTAGRLGEEDS